jgi:hypothetical protein
MGTGAGIVYAGTDPALPDDLSGDDGTNGNNLATRPQDGTAPAAQTYGDPAQHGPLLTLEPKAAIQYAIDLFTEQRETYQRPEIEWEVNERRRGGETNVWVMKQQDQNYYFVWTPPGSSGRLPPPSLNKADRLCGRVTAQIFSDPAIPQASPATGASADRDAAEFESRILTDVDDESTLDDSTKHRAAFDAAHCTGHFWIEYGVNPYGGGRQPLSIDAGREAQHVDEAEFQTITDPMTGEPTQQPWPERVPRYVAADGTLSDAEHEATLRWVPQLTSRLMHPRNVRLWPTSATNVWEARMLVRAGYWSVGEVKAWLPKAQFADTQWEQLAKERPSETNKLLPRRNGKPFEPTTKRLDDKLVFVISVYGVECHEYGDGVEFHAIGDSGLFVDRGPWLIPAKAAEGDSPAVKREPMDLPFTQHIQVRGDPLSPIHIGTMRVLGPANEARAQTVGNLMDLSDKNLTLKTYIPTNSILTGKEALLPFLTHVPINPGGEPIREDPYPIPKELSQLLELWSAEMDDASGLQQAGQALETPDAASGRAKLAVLGQVQAGLSDLRLNAVRAQVRGWRIKAQLLRARMDVSTITQWQGKDGEYKARRWLGADLGTTRNIQLKPGSFSMLAPTQKADRLLQLAAVPGLIPMDDVRDQLFSNVGSELGWEDNPHLMRVRQQIAQWEAGPEGGVVQPGQPQVQGVDAMGQPMLGPPGPDARALAIFEPRMVDSQTDVAQLRVRELGRAMATSTYGELAPAWRAGLDQAYQAMVQAMAPPPMPIPNGPPQRAPQGGAPPELPSGPPQGQPDVGMLTASEQQMASGGGP